MLHKVKKVEWLGEYKLRLQFNDGKIKIVDLSEDMKKAKNLFLDLVNVDYFKQVECDGFSICWPNGIDYCPDLLYKMRVTQNTKKPRARKRKARVISKVRKIRKSKTTLRKKSKI